MKKSLISNPYLVATENSGVPSYRCPIENPHPFRNKTFCCSRPVDFQWNNDGYCYGRRQKCTHNQGCDTCESKTHLDPTSPIQVGTIQRGM